MKKAVKQDPQEEVRIAVLRRFAKTREKLSRQPLRNDQFQTSFIEISKRYPGEPRMRRRRIARAIMRRFWAERPVKQ